jgi:iron complex transport system permease protein
MLVVDILGGSVSIPISQIINVLVGKGSDNVIWNNIIIQYRLPKAIVAIAAGAGLSVCGLQMQTLFRNSLADPSILGISSGASLGVALVILSATVMGGMGVLTELSGHIAIVVAAALGAGLSLLAVTAISRFVSNNGTLLIIGLMIGQISISIVGILEYFSTSESMQGFFIWNMGSFSNVPWSEIYILLPLVFIGVIISLISSKALNALMLGDNYAQSMGINIKHARFLLVISTGLLTGSLTAFCGPIAFIGLAVPHITRGIFKESDHRLLIPAVAIVGALLALFCDVIAHFPGQTNTLPVNVITSLIGAPVVIIILLKQRKKASI